MTNSDANEKARASIVLGGGIGLGVFQAGAVEAITASDRIEICSVSGSSIGAINAALIAGNAPEDRITRLRSFWSRVTRDGGSSLWLDPFGLMNDGDRRLTQNWANVLATALMGSPGLFRPRALMPGRGEGRSWFDNSEAMDTLRASVDFDRLNDGEVRCCLAATDLEAGEAIFFDTARGDRIGPEHILASSSLVPAFEPVRIGNRLLGDGGFACNVPLEAEIGRDRSGGVEPLCFVLDLYTPEGGHSHALNRWTERSFDLIFGMQTRMRLAAFQREWDLWAELNDLRSRNAPEATAAVPGVDLFYMSYRGNENDAGFSKPFDFSSRTLADRHREGRAAAEQALRLCATLDAPVPGLRIHKIVQES